MMSFLGVAPIRVLTCVILLGLASACARTPPPDTADGTATSPRQLPVAAAAPSTPSNKPAPVALSFSTDDARIGTEIGERTLGAGVSTTGKEGWLLFGPYIALPAGHYQVELRGSVAAGHAGFVHVDVAQSKANELLAAAEIDAPVLFAPPSPDGLVVLPFTLAKASSDLEIRVRVTKAAKLSVLSYVIRSVP